MAIDFPNTPATNDTYTVGNKTWIYDGTTWNTYNTTSFSAETLPGTTLKSTVTGSSLTSVGTLAGLAVTGSTTISSTSGDTLKVTNTGVGNSFLVEDSASVDSTPFVIDAAGRVGIGMTAPARSLDVIGNIRCTNSATQDGIQLQGSGTGTSSRNVSLTSVSLTASQTATFPDATGTVITTGNLSSITSVGTLSSLAVTGATTSGSFVQGTDYFSPYQGFRNKIINGGFEVWQRGTARTFMQAGQYLADRWTVRQYQQNAHQRTAVTPVAGMQTRYALRASSSTTAETAGGSRMWTNTMLESADSIPLRGKTMTFSFWVRFSSATCSSSTATPYGNWDAYIDYCSSTTDASMVTTGADGGGGSVTLTNGSLPTTWTKYTGTYTIPSNANNVGIQFGFAGLGNTASADTVWYEITQVQLEHGSVATPFEQRPIQTELALCQRYFQKSYATNTAPGTATDSGAYVAYGVSNVYVLLLITIPLRVPMRVTPTTITYYRVDVANTVGWAYTNAGGGSGNGTPTTVYSSDSSFTPYLSIGSTSYIGGQLFGHWTASAEL